MKKAPAIVVGLCLVVGILLLLNRPAERKQAAAESSAVSATPAEGASSASGDTERSVKPATSAIKADASQSLAVKGPVVHTAQDFISGANENLKIVDGTLQLGDDPKFTPRLQPYKHFGIHVSPEMHSEEPFETITPALDVLRGQNSDLTFEIRTATPSGVWSTWQEITADSKPTRIELPSTAWQYRVTLYANDVAQGPKLRSVSITTKQTEIAPDPGATFSANNRP